MTFLASLIRTLLYYMYMLIILAITPTIMVLLKIIFSKEKSRKYIFFYQNKVLRLFYFLGNIKIKKIGYEKIIDLKKNEQHKFLIISNHLSSFDIFTIILIMPFPLVFLSKPLYFFIPFLASTLHLLGHVPIDRKNPRKAFSSMKKAKKKMNDGLSIAVFPEGSRSKDGEIKNFNSSPLSLLKEDEKITIIPITLIGTEKIQKKNSLMINQNIIFVYFSNPIPHASRYLKEKDGKKKLIQKIENQIRDNYRCHFLENKNL